MKYYGVVTLAILAGIAVMSNGAPESSSDQNYHQYGPPPPPNNGSSSQGGMRFDQGGSFQVNAKGSESSRFLVKRDLANQNTPLHPHVHTAACGGNRPPPANITSA
ncbi:uncharacterized protein [Euwallacea fornicatus]|uniref:uncharacterized protein n=1 Tax=Euwallacea fornicatus TaxID=995702 RepID=UPI00338D71AC